MIYDKDLVLKVCKRNGIKVTEGKGMPTYKGVPMTEKEIAKSLRGSFANQDRVEFNSISVNFVCYKTEYIKHISKPIRELKMECEITISSEDVKPTAFEDSNDVYVVRSLDKHHFMESTYKNSSIEPDVA